MKPIHRYSLVPLLLLLAAWGGCTSNPFKTAETAEQTADALYGTYAIAQVQGERILKDAAISDEVKRPIAEAMVAAQGPANSFQDALIQYSAVSAQLAAGTTTQDKLVIAQQNVDHWLAEAKPLIDQLIAAVGRIVQ
jgi:hypothetical protein